MKSSNLISPYGIIPNLNAIRMLIVLAISVGYASTMPRGPGTQEYFSQFGYDPSLIGIQLLFFYSGFLGLRSLRRHGSSYKYLASRFLRNGPILALYTLAVVLLIYPIFGASDSAAAQQAAKLARYFSLTVSCIAPGQLLPGLLDDANYMCLIQGTVWTFRWGMAAHLAVAIGNFIGLYDKNRLILFMAVSLIFVFAGLEYYMVKSGNMAIATLIPPLRVGSMFVTGMAAYAYQDRLPQSWRGRLFLLLILYGSTTLLYTPLLPWTPFIEIGLTLSWIWISFMLLMTGPRLSARLRGWPNLTLTLYLCNWPIAQVLLLLRPEINAWSLIMLTLPVSTAFAYVMYKLVAQKCYAQAEHLSGLNGGGKLQLTPARKSSKAPLFSQS